MSAKGCQLTIGFVNEGLRFNCCAFGLDHLEIGVVFVKPDQAIQREIEGEIEGIVLNPHRAGQRINGVAEKPDQRLFASLQLMGGL